MNLWLRQTCSHSIERGMVPCLRGLQSLAWPPRAMASLCWQSAPPVLTQREGSPGVPALTREVALPTDTGYHTENWQDKWNLTLRCPIPRTQQRFCLALEFSSLGKCLMLQWRRHLLWGQSPKQEAQDSGGLHSCMPRGTSWCRERAWAQGQGPYRAVTVALPSPPDLSAELPTAPATGRDEASPAVGECCGGSRTAGRKGDVEEPSPQSRPPPHVHPSHLQPQPAPSPSPRPAPSPSTIPEHR